MNDGRRAQPLRLSVLDFGWPGDAVELAPRVEELGYSRYWIGEHHTPLQCGNPLMLSMLVAGSTQALRVGSAGVCLPGHSPYRVAEDAKLLELFFSGRIDLGVCNGLGTGPDLAPPLFAGLPRRSFDELATELHGLLTARPDTLDRSSPGPAIDAAPQMWLLGGMRSAQLAARLGTAYCFSEHHNRGRQDGPTVVNEYRKQFRPSSQLAQPCAAVAVAGLCADSEQAAKNLFERVLGSSPHPPTVFAAFIGSAEHAAERLNDVQSRFGVDDIAILDLTCWLNGTFVERLELRTRVFELLAKAVGL